MWALILLSSFVYVNDPALWLARSCVGEAGWESSETGECAAIAHVYRKRAAVSGRTYQQTVRKYSAAVKPGAGPRWIRELERHARRPYGFSHRLRWSAYRPCWKRMLAMADQFMRGEVDDPTPAAMHYGGRMDRHRLSRRYWKRIETPFFRNWFFRPIRGGGPGR